MKRPSGEFIFILIVLFAYFILFIFNYSLALRAFLASLNIVLRILPALVLVLFFMFLSNYFFDSKKIVRHLGEESGVRGWFLSVIGGILSTGPIFVWYPLLKELKDHGMRTAFIAVFFYNRAVKLPLLPVMVFYFGVPFTLILTFYMVLFSVVNALVISRIQFYKTEFKS